MKKLVLITFFILMLALHSFAIAEEDWSSYGFGDESADDAENSSSILNETESPETLPEISNDSLNSNTSGNISQNESSFSDNASINSGLQEDDASEGVFPEAQDSEPVDLNVQDRGAFYTKIDTLTAIITLALGAAALAIIIFLIISFIKKPKQG
jgi:hypothetical protein